MKLSSNLARRFLPLPFVLGVARRGGIEIRRYRPAASRRMELLTARGIVAVLDVGANTGQYGRELRACGYSGRIESFEPIPEAFQELEHNTALDYRWRCHQLALGDYEGDAAINVTEASPASSLLPAARDRSSDEMGRRVRFAMSVPVTRLDALDLAIPRQRTLLKVDVQGYEAAVFRGAQNTLTAVSLIECELSIRPMYEKQPLLSEIVDMLARAGFRLIALNPGFYAPGTGEIIQFDGIFERDKG